MRFAHVVKRNERCESPTRAAWVSIATDAKQQRGKDTTYVFKHGWLRTGEKSKHGRVWLYRDHSCSTARQLLALLVNFTRNKTRTYCFVENSRVTLAVLDAFTALYELGWRLTQAVIECPPLIAKWRRGNASLQLLAMENVWPTQSTGTSNGFPATLTTERGENQSSMPSVERERQRVRQLQQQTVEWFDFLKTNDLGGFAPTAASQAFRTFRHKFMTHEIFIDTNMDALKLARAAYSGGRTECFYIGKTSGEFYLLDVNSMYAAVMAQMRVPVRLVGYTRRCDVSDLSQWAKRYVVIADCRVRVDLPVFAVRDQAKLLFPVGEFWCTLAGDEIQFAADSGYLRGVRQAACYAHAPAFRDYTLAFWNQRIAYRNSGDTLNADRCKLMLASFYGKWGQSGGTWEKVKDAKDASLAVWCEVDMETHTVIDWRQFGGIVQRRMCNEETYESSPAIAACVTANARMVLWAYMLTAGLENVLYVDTDSLLVNQDGFERLREHINPGQLGDLRLEGQYGSVNIRGPKDYSLDNRSRHKGRSASAVCVADDTFDQDEIVGLQQLMVHGDISKARARRVRRHFTHNYDKGTVTASGRVAPFRRD